MPTSTQLTLSHESRIALEALARSHRGRADEARRARIILLLADGYSYSTISERVDCTAQTIATWKARYLADGVAGLRGRHRGSKARVLTPQLEARILNWTRKPPADGTTHWSTRRLANKLDVPHTIVARAWEAGRPAAPPLGTLSPIDGSELRGEGGRNHRAVLDPPQHAAVFCVDEKTAIQALHADVFVLAQPSRTLVLEDRTRCHGAGPLHLRHRPAPQADALYQALQQDRDTHPLGGCRPLAEDRVTAVQLVRTVH